MNFSFHPEAEDEFYKAIDYYESIQPGLGYNFSLEISNAIERAMEFPEAWSVLDGEIRRSLVNKFPYGVLYTQERDSLFIIAIMNLQRKPGYWKYRN